MADPNQGQVIATAWEALMTDEPTDNIMTAQALIYLLNTAGFKQSASGGRIFEETIQYAVNTTFRGYGEMESLDTTRVSVFDCARYDQKIFAGTVVFSDLELARNQTPNRKIDVEADKLENGKESALEQLNTALYLDGTGNSGNDFDGLAKIISDTPTTGTVGGINAANFPFWRNRQATGAKTTTAFDNLLTSAESIFNQCSLGGIKRNPTGIVSDRASFEGYISKLTNIERIVRDSGGKATGGDIGFLSNAINFKGQPWVYDENCTALHAYFVNNNFLKLQYLKGYWMKMKEKVEPSNQLAAIYRVETFGNLTASARRHLGVLSAIT